MTWTASALIALGCFSGAYLLIGRIGQQVTAVPLLAWLLIPMALATVCHLAITGTKPWVPASTLPMLLGAAVLCYVGNLAQTHALSAAPNPGSALAIIGASTALVAVAAACMGSPLGAGKMIGIGLCVAGVLTVSLSRS